MKENDEEKNIEKVEEYEKCLTLMESELQKAEEDLQKVSERRKKFLKMVKALFYGVRKSD